MVQHIFGLAFTLTVKDDNGRDCLASRWANTLDLRYLTLAERKPSHNLLLTR